ncbi:MAG TPA: DUF2283 domain-containing protein [Candidatus Nanoarchaeia archaeon]|nr:DUF2283 domain-containing protein [Candidatus Nanoarchaeia archaeon]
MTKKKILKALGKGEVDYDYTHDILFFKIKNRTYEHSLELDNIIIDFDQEEYPVGIQIFDASKLFFIDKLALKTIQAWEFRISIDQGKITIALLFTTTKRNKILERGQNIIREIQETFPNSEVLCTLPIK